MQLRLPNYAFLLLALAASVAIFYPALSQMYEIWNLQPEYSYGFVIPVLSAYLVWRQRDELRTLEFRGCWYGLILVGVGIALRVLGQFSTMSTIVRYAFLLTFYGIVLTATGPAVFRRLWLALAVLIFMVPLPIFMTERLSLDLQLISSWLGTQLIRAAGVSVLLEGNVIDLGTYQLQVAEACSGLRYLFPLMTLAFLIAYLFRGALWKRALIFLSSIPITVLMNSLRIAVIGTTVDRWGPGMAEGVLHEFEGWLVFMLSTAAVLATALALARLGGVGWRDAFDLRPIAPRAVPARTPLAIARPVPAPFLAAMVLAIVAAATSLAVPARSEPVLARTSLLAFPTHVGDWVGQQSALESVYVDALRMDDYLLANYRDHDGGPPLNFYVAYYDSQRSSRRVHSPINCIPGGGWQIVQLETRQLPLAGSPGVTLHVNRLVIELGAQKQLVYYWFRERGRTLTDENTVKWYLFWDSLTRNRTDGALVRIIAPLPPGVPETVVESKVQRFAALVEPQLGRYIPD